ncbi:MAG: phosphoenolpyruvate--protein phosphotransferase [Pseudomonadota bacterium]
MKADNDRNNAVIQPDFPLIIQGKPLSPGLVKGLIHIHQGILGPIDAPENADKNSYRQYDTEEELSRLDVATASISDDLFVLAERVEKEIDARLSEVFGAHQLMVNDAALRLELRKEIIENMVSASSAVKTVFLRWEKRFLLMESQIARDKGDDMRDLSIRLHNALAGITVHPLDNIPDACVLATSRLLPSDTIFLASRSVSAVLMEYGSVGSHAALFAREIGLPAISGFVDLFNSVSDGALVLVDADAGIVTLRPSLSQTQAFQKKTDDKLRVLQAARKYAQRPALTKDGVEISVFANVGCREDTERAMSNGAEGIGLYRIEQVYLGRSTPPSREELVNEMRETLAAAKGRSVCIRLLDIGADKPLPFLGFFAESNPALGRRGIRLLREYPELLKTQVLAIFDLAKEFNICVLIPMVTLPEDALAVKNMFIELGKEQAVLSLPKLGAMIETPAAALSAVDITKHVDFLSFGTNDLTQYSFAADRENAAVESYFNNVSQVIFRLLEITHGDVPNVPLSLCGELAGRPEHIARLLQCGIRTLSVAAPLIPQVKEAIRDCRCVLSL